eukprot:5763962-Pyramimonas_sp.AAC.1
MNTEPPENSCSSGCSGSPSQAKTVGGDLLDGAWVDIAWVGEEGPWRREAGPPWSTTRGQAVGQPPTQSCLQSPV